MDKKIIAQNRKARHDYFILETFEAGIVLTGTEIKSVREGRVNLKDGYAKIENGECWLYNVHISPYEKGTYYNHDPLRPRKLLLRKDEIRRLIGKTQQKGLTLIPLSIYIKDGKWAKVELALAQGKKIYDKRHAIAERDARIEMERARKVAKR
ncbi:MAG TPA: SsrA-binding protein SmpB [Acetomicrobium flavidum]|uniref:SsrA-binding protein n=2 Tax=Acetomicrobium TaxID=49894 RepID=I4BXQ8_ACEMN|nr:SsrA-binding protein SmpB [Acetomicrobium mobile]NLG94004.1 SsrA-binding protein SmpB [Acetomicrobium flavidum]AFM22065.1 SsrA-binding protein [Acetomicrobium mobile DSM 13181]SIN75077.1 SsrA-binding protein [Acetomicrobium flavidum]HOJ81873.1 SsrA-binding protein SmpB [Acetomicrobium flavidum]HOM30585.1 SsrA-binding protein SmpB [Acetomicrobium flavidum]